jgi:hypothetical protein
MTTPFAGCMDQTADPYMIYTLAASLAARTSCCTSFKEGSTCHQHTRCAGGRILVSMHDICTVSADTHTALGPQVRLSCWL